MNITISTKKLTNLFKACFIALLLSMIHTSHAETVYYQSTCPCGVVNSVYGSTCASCGETYTYTYTNPSTYTYTYPSTYTGSLTYGGYSGYRGYREGYGVYLGGGGRVIETDGHDYWGGNASTW